MKKIIIGMMAFASFIFSASAQDAGQMKHHQHHDKFMMMKGLNLTSAQKEQMKSMRENTKLQLMELNKNENITVKEYRSQKMAILKSQKDQMEKVLTTEQKNQLAQNKADWKAKREAMVAKRMDKMKTRLNLSDDQVSKMKANRESGQAKEKAIRENSQLSMTEKKEQLIALKKDQKNSFKQLLTPEQISKMEQLKKERMDKQSRK